MGLLFSTQKSCSLFLNVAPSGKEKSICSPKLRNCPQQLESAATIKRLWLHLFLSMTKLLGMSADSEKKHLSQESTDAWLGDWTGLKLHFYPGVTLWEARADLPSWGGAKPDTQLAQEAWVCPSMAGPVAAASPGWLHGSHLVWIACGNSSSKSQLTLKWVQVEGINWAQVKNINFSMQHVSDFWLCMSVETLCLKVSFQV